jgi:hypothetical protein
LLSRRKGDPASPQSPAPSGVRLSHAGGCFITARTWKGSLLFNGAGFFRAVRQAWEALPAIFGGIELDECVVMPNHFHGIVWVFDDRA